MKKGIEVKEKELLVREQELDEREKVNIIVFCDILIHFVLFRKFCAFLTKFSGDIAIARLRSLI